MGSRIYISFIKYNKLFDISVITIVNIYLWQIFLIGYIRYASILLVLCCIVYICILQKIKINNNLCYKILLSILVIVTIPSVIYNFGVVIKDTNSLSGFVNEYILNAKMIFKDRKTDKLEIDGILGAIGDDSLLPTMLNNGNKIYNLEEWVTITNDKTQNMYNEKIINKEIYLPVDKKTMDRKKDYLNRNNFHILDESELIGNYTFLSPTDKLYLLKVIKTDYN